MTTDTDALKKRFARALYVTWWTDHMQDPSASYDHPLNEDAREACESAADALLPIVFEEVRKAKAGALRETVEKRAITIPDALGYKVSAVTVEDLLDAADEYEIGGSDEHR